LSADPPPTCPQASPHLPPIVPPSGPISVVAVGSHHNQAFVVQANSPLPPAGSSITAPPPIPLDNAHDPPPRTSGQPSPRENAVVVSVKMDSMHKFVNVLPQKRGRPKIGSSVPLDPAKRKAVDCLSAGIDIKTYLQYLKFPPSQWSNFTVAHLRVEVCFFHYLDPYYQRDVLNFQSNVVFHKGLDQCEMYSVPFRSEPKCSERLLDTFSECLCDLKEMADDRFSPNRRSAICDLADDLKILGVLPLPRPPSELDLTEYCWTSFGRAPPSRTVYGRLFLHVTKSFSDDLSETWTLHWKPECFPSSKKSPFNAGTGFSKKATISHQCDIHRCFDKTLLYGWCSDMQSRIDETDHLYRTKQFSSIIGLDPNILPPSP
jgi:hypothetical protein